MLAPLTMTHAAFNSRARRGITLVEILVALAVLGVLLAVAAPSLSDMLERRRVIAAANEVSSILHFARAEPLAISDRVWVVFKRAGTVPPLSCVAVVTESLSPKNCKCDATPVCSAGDSKPLRVYQLEEARGVTFAASATSWNGVNDYMALSTNQRTTTAEGVKVVVTGARTGAKLHVEFNQVGRVRICTPDGSLGGYPACG